MIEGCSLFFSTNIAAGVVVIRLGGTMVPTTELQQLIADADADPRAPFVDTITIYPDQLLVLPSGTSVHFGNHSCDPTLWHTGPYVAGYEAGRHGR